MMFLKFVLWVLLLAISSAQSSDIQKAYATWNPSSPEVQVHDGPKNANAVAWARFQNDINNTGFAYLEVSTNELYSDNLQAYAAGVVEGYLTRDLITKQYKNVWSRYCINETDYCNRLHDFLAKNLNFMNDQTKKHSLNSSYWHQVNLILLQLQGIDDVYNGRVEYSPERSYRNVTPILFLNFDTEIQDLESTLNRSSLSHIPGLESCSALVKVQGNNDDIFFSHNTWLEYRTMLRILKKYTLNYHDTLTSETLISGKTTTFSSTPGRLFSGDDFLLVSSGLATMETTLTIYNTSLLKDISHESNLEWIRNIVANRLATSGKEWTDVFSKFNSGTYNNEWMILDYKKFTPGQQLQDGLLWILEQMPGRIRRKDVTDVLRSRGYWASYNRPYFKDIFEQTGYTYLVKKYGNWFSYDKNPRALIFERDHTQVVDMESMMKLMRQNDYTNDNLSVCNCNPLRNAYNAIAARSDLNPPNGTYPFDALGHHAYGAIDVKVTNYSLFKTYEFVAVSGPTFDPLPPFQWSTSGFDDLHDGQPDLWTFKPILHKWNSTF